MNKLPIREIPKEIIFLIIGAIITIPLISVINSAIDPLTTIYSVNNESLGNITIPQVVQTSNYPVVENSETIRLTNTTDTVTLTKDTHYTVVSYPEGKFNITSTADLTGTIIGEIDYKWHSSDYISNAMQRTIINLLPLIAIVGIILSIILIKFWELL